MIYLDVPKGEYKMMKRSSQRRVVACIILLAMFLVGCQPTEGKMTERGESMDEREVITLWTIATENDAFHTPFVKAIADYERENPHVKIKMESFENQAYKAKLKSAVAANELPDIFFTWGGGFSKTFVETGKVLPLDSYYENYKEELPKAAVSYAVYDETLYGTTYVTPVSMLFYNKRIFTELDLKAPETWEELFIACEVLQKNEITPLALSTKDSWALAMLHDALALKSAGHDAVQDVLTKEGQRYNDADFLIAAEKLQALIEMQAFSEVAAELSNDEIQTTFIEGNAGMYIMGSWTGGVISTDATNPEEFDVVPVPVLGENAGATDFMGGAVDTLMVSATTKNKDLTANAAFEIARNVSKYAFLEGAGIAAWTTQYDTSSVNELSTKIADYTKNATSFTLWFDTLMEPSDAANYLMFLQELYIQNIDAATFVEEMDTQLNK